MIHDIKISRHAHKQTLTNVRFSFCSTPRGVGIQVSCATHSWEGLSTAMAARKLRSCVKRKRVQEVIKGGKYENI